MDAIRPRRRRIERSRRRLVRTHTQSEWIGRDPPPQARRYGVSFNSRSTMVFRKEAGDWRVVHVHFSEASTAPRPAGI
ncbi:MAG: nuclear transport factor 2 family protein [Stellaceae bacterium]